MPQGRPLRPFGQNASMAYQLRILAGFAETNPAALIGEVDAAITTDGSWERYFEVRMGAGPTVHIAHEDKVDYVVAVSWGSQRFARSYPRSSAPIGSRTSSTRCGMPR